MRSTFRNKIQRLFCRLGRHWLVNHTFAFRDKVSLRCVYRANCLCGKEWITDSLYPLLGFRMRADNKHRELDTRIKSVLFELGASHAILVVEEYHRDVTYNDSHWSAAAERSFFALLDTYNITSEFIAYAKAYELKNRRA